MNNKIITIILAFFASLTMMHQGLAAGSAMVSLGHLELNPHDQASLQRGAKTFMNYCSGCHSLEYLRYSTMAKDIGITDDKGEVAANLVRNNLIFTGAKIGEQIDIAMKPADSKSWFGAAPPDLTLVTRLRGNDWVYNYLLGFYRDDSKIWGVNNAIFPDVGMPHVLAELQGVQEPIYRVYPVDVEGKVQEHKEIVGMKLVKPGVLTPAEYQVMVTDLVNFLAYAAEPIKDDRIRIGKYVLLFLVVLLGFAYLLKREYWKDVH